MDFSFKFYGKPWQVLIVATLIGLIAFIWFVVAPAMAVWSIWPWLASLGL